MIRRWIRSHARPTLLLPLAIAVPIQAARSQDHTIQDRLDRLERDLSMLQRQVYRGASPSAVGSGSNTAVDVEIRMDRLEAQMRELTGRVEETMNSVEQLRGRLEQINSDIDVRLGQEQNQLTNPSRRSSSGSGFTGSAPPGALAARGFPPAPTPLSPPVPAMPPGTLVPAFPYPPWRPGTLTPPGPAQAPAAADPANAGSGAGLHPPSPGALHEGSTADQYNYAFGLLRQADYPAAEDAFKNFIHEHPNDPLAGSAQYWLGETYYARADYADAASAFAEGYKRYPKGAKAADELLKIGMSLARANQKQNACVAFAQLDREFPNPTNAIKERARDEKKKLGC
jgi:tol-pal system protein YbgF